MLKIISHGQQVVKESYFISYEWVERPGSGFDFPCNMQGEINFNDMVPEALENYKKCESDEYAVIYRGLQRHEHSYWEPTVAICYCGEEITLESNTNECEHCNQLYNSAGQQLSDPSNWGEETGEHPSDVRREMK